MSRGVVAASLGTEPSGLSVGLPGIPLDAAVAASPTDSLVWAAQAGDARTAVRTEAGGAFQAVIHIPSATSPREYAFDIGAPGTWLSILSDGSAAVVDERNEVRGIFAPPWAVDAGGAPVATTYAVAGSRLVQRIHPNESTRFPVVADPFWIPALAVMARLSVHVAQRLAQRGISQQLLQQVVQNGARTRGNQPGTSVFTQGRGGTKIRVIVNDRTGTIITATRG